MSGVLPNAHQFGRCGPQEALRSAGAELRSRLRSTRPPVPAPRKVTGSSEGGCANLGPKSSPCGATPCDLREGVLLSSCPLGQGYRGRKLGSAGRPRRAGRAIPSWGRIRPRFLASAAFTDLRLAARGKPACDGYPLNMACFLRCTYRGAAGKLQAGVRSCIHHRGGSTLSTICEAKMVPVRAPA